MPLDTPRFNAWCEAEQAANAAEHKLYELLVQAATSGESPRLMEHAVSARLARKRAHELFDDAMKEMRFLADSLHFRHISGDAAAPSDQSPPIQSQAAGCVPKPDCGR
jgi:hypothetical protein